MDQKRDSIVAAGVVVATVIAVILFAHFYLGVTFTAPVADHVSWNPASINSPNVSVIVIEKVSSDPNTYELASVVASTPNSGSYPAPSLSAGQSVEIGCLTDQECRAIDIPQ